MALADAIRAFARAYEVERPAVGVYVDGRWSGGPVTIVTVSASVQPTAGRDLRLLEEGARASESITILTPDLVRTGDEKSGQAPDVVRYKGARYQVQRVESWDEIGGFYKALAVKIPGT